MHLQEGATPHELSWGSWMLVLHGDPLDDRGTTVLNELTSKASSASVLRYLPESLEVVVGESVVPADDLPSALDPLIAGRVLIEATTMGLAEVVLCCKALRALGQDAFDIVYVEPGIYSRPHRPGLLQRRDFELSSEVPGYRAIPGTGLILRDRKPLRSVFFLGYEEARLRRAFEELQMLSASKTSVTFGVPAYKAGWEMDAMANNISVIREQNIRGGVHFCSAENPFAVIELLSEVYDGLEGGERLVLAPIGTKPHGIGAALFAAVRSDVGIIYDHPQRTKNRSSNVGHWHLFTVEEFQNTP